MRSIVVTLLALSIATTAAEDALTTKRTDPDDPINTPHLVYPKDPRGYAVLTDLLPNRPIPSEKIYLVAIDAVASWGQKGWNHVVTDRAHRYSLESHGVTLAFRTIALPQQKYQLELRYLILGMLHLIDRMTKGEQFCVSTVSVLMFNEPTGFVRIDIPRTSAQTGASSNKTANTNQTSVNALPRDVSASRRIVDPTDPDFAIVYERKGERMPYVDLFGAILYAIATAAQASNEEHCRDLGGFNEKQSVVYRINGKRPTESGYLLTYEMVRTGLKMLAPAMYDDDGPSAEVSISFEYRGDVMGYGHIDLSDFADHTTR